MKPAVGHVVKQRSIDSLNKEVRKKEKKMIDIKDFIELLLKDRQYLESMSESERRYYSGYKPKSYDTSSRQSFCSPRGSNNATFMSRVKSMR